MNPSQQMCDPDRLERYLCGVLSAQGARAVEVHLETCGECRRSLETSAADDAAWQEASDLLGDPRWRNEDSRAAVNGTTEGEAHSSRQMQSVIESLAPTDDPAMLGRIDGYEVSGVIGSGGMGAVLKGFDRSLNRVVAIKVMAPHLASSGAARQRFAREAQAAAAMTHDNLIDIYGVSEANGLPYLVMPYAKGPSLQKRIDSNGPLPLLEVLRIGQQIAAGLAAAHEQGLVHRDIKPANILLSDGIERLLITDFGLARAVDDASVTKTGVIAGTPQYMSPEQARGDAVDHRSDLFSLGSVLYTGCTGRPPFRAESAYGILRRITDNDPRPIREINLSIPEWFCRVIDRLHQKHAGNRFQTAAEVSELLKRCIAHVQTPGIPLPQELRPATRRSRVLGVGLLAGCLLTGGIAVWIGPAENDTGSQREHVGLEPLLEGEPTAVVQAEEQPPQLPFDETDVTAEDTLWDDAFDVSPESVRQKAATLNTETQQFFAPNSSISPAKVTP